MFDGHFCSRGRLNGRSYIERQLGEFKDETPFRYVHAEIRTRVVVIYDPMCYQLDQGGASTLAEDKQNTHP